MLEEICLVLEGNKQTSSNFSRMSQGLILKKYVDFTQSFMTRSPCCHADVLVGYKFGSWLAILETSPDSNYLVVLLPSRHLSRFHQRAGPHQVTGPLQARRWSALRNWNRLDNLGGNRRKEFTLREWTH
jgi:hypothetical protein